MNTREFLNLLEGNLTKELIFEFKENHFVPKNFHITEIKSKHIESVDCGGFSHNYDETVVQLWTPNNEQKEIGMDGAKALKIFKIVDGKTKLKTETPIFFEWGFGEIPTSIYDVRVVENNDNQLVIKLFVPPTVCKPNLQLEVVGNETGSACCGDSSSNKCC